MAKKTLRDVDAAGKRVLVRADFNVPLDAQGRITDERRIVESLPTIQYLLERGAKVILMSHLGRPKGVDDKLRLNPVAEALEKHLGRPLKKLDDCVGPQVEAAVQQMKPGDVILLQNLRFHGEEEKNDPEFSQQLARLGEVYVNDAFGTAHRAHASTEGVTHYLRPAVAGFLMQKEIEIMGRALSQPARPFVAVLGGVKVSDKIGVIENLIPKVDALLIGGGMAYTFFKAQGKEIGNSILEAGREELARQLMEKARSAKIRFELPSDVVVVRELKADSPPQIVPADAIPKDMMGVDIGPETARRFAGIVRDAATVIMNGPMGIFELAPFAEGTRAVGQAMAACKGTTIVGGGDTAAAMEHLGFASSLTHVSTGGGASLEFLEGKALPGVAALDE
jgi:phosphoglycerate kinase